MRILLVLAMIALAGCMASRMQSQGTDSPLSSRFDPAQRLSPIAFVQNATMKDSSVHEDPSLLRVGMSRDKITAAFGTPNQINHQGGQEQDVYEFNPDGSKFVKPKTYARNIAAGVFTHGMATVVHQARIHYAEQQLTVYHLTYGPDGTVQSIQKESRRDTSHDRGVQD
jgi:outer membrane protein assembly factor BamE (lipoprotein component of BamABCDE complex)